MTRIASATSAADEQASSTTSSGSRRWSKSTTRAGGPSSNLMICSGSSPLTTPPPPSDKVALGGLRAFVPRSEVPRLLFGQLVDVDAHRGELQPGDLAIDLVGHDVDLLLELAGVLHRVLGRERLVRKGHVHDECRMALGGGEVDEPAVRDEVEPAAVVERELLDELAREARLGRERLQRRDVD